MRFNRASQVAMDRPSGMTVEKVACVNVSQIVNILSLIVASTIGRVDRISSNEESRKSNSRS